jgi:hypothetical protein
MKKLTTSAVILLFALGATVWAQADKDAIEAKEKAAWNSFKDKKADDFKKVVDKDFRAVYSDGIVNMQQELDDMKNWDMKSFSFADYNAFSDEKDVYVTTYTVTLAGTKNGKDVSGTYNCGTVWKKEGNDWLAIFHTNILQEKAAK